MVSQADYANFGDSEIQSEILPPLWNRSQSFSINTILFYSECYGVGFSLWQVFPTGLKTLASETTFYASVLSFISIGFYASHRAFLLIC